LLSTENVKTFYVFTINLNQMFSMKKRLNHLLKIPGKALTNSCLPPTQKNSRMLKSLSLPLLRYISDNLCHVQTLLCS